MNRVERREVAKLKAENGLLRESLDATGRIYREHLHEIVAFKLALEEARSLLLELQAVLDGVKK